MTLTFYNVSDDRRVLKKNLGAQIVKYANVMSKEPLDFANPVFIIVGLNSNFNFNKCNYCYCTELDRYYFIDNYINLAGDRTEVRCSIDVRQTYADYILNSDVIVFKQSSKNLADKLIADSRLPVQVNTESRTFNFQDGEMGGVTAVDWSFVLNVFGGGDNNE